MYMIFIEYSVGAMYMVVLNLPRAVRYKVENIILIGIIPGPNEPKQTMNSFLKPLIDELKEFWSGVLIPCEMHPLKNICVRGAIICCTCDIPATRKVCGFLGHTANLGCSKCMKKFVAKDQNNYRMKMDYSGYNRGEWPLRSLSVHREQCNNYLKAETAAKQRLIENEYGLRYSVMVELPYFNPIRNAVVDPMHNLYLGTAKHAMETWVDQGYLSKKDFEVMQQRISTLITPRAVGRIPLKIGSSFAGFTADQWRNWTTIFSPVVLKDILPNNHLRCWLLFVRACSLLSTRIISIEAINQADSYLVEFCKQFCILYGAHACTPNMHLHLHLKECLLDYGPVHSFWCFAFERYNGLLGKYHTNNQCIEVQVMKKFLREQQIRSLEVPSETSSLFSSLQTKLSGSLLESAIDNEDIFRLQTLAEYDQFHSDYSITCNSMVKFLSPIYSGVFTTNEIHHLEIVYSYIYPNYTISHLSHFYEASKRCEIGDEYFTSMNTKERSSVIMAYWPVESYNEPLEKQLQVGYIQRFIKHNIKISKENYVETKTHIICEIEWCIQHVQRSWYGVSATMCTLMKYAKNPCSFMPIQRIAYHCAYGIQDVVIPPNQFSEKVLVAIPIYMKYSL